MELFWFVAGVVSASLFFAMIWGPHSRRLTWWQVLIWMIYAAVCIFLAAVSALTFAEGNTRGGSILLTMSFLAMVVIYIGVRAALGSRRRAPSSSQKTREAS